MIKRVCLFLALIVVPSSAFAQKITNADANQEGKAIAVTYDLAEMADISLYLTQDGGRTEKLIPQTYLEGDAGKKVSPGVGKKVFWHVLDQYPNQDFKEENMSFIVKGKPSRRFFAMLNAGYSLDSGFNMGASFGTLGSIGWYVKGITTLAMPKNAHFGCDENGYVDGLLPAYSGRVSRFKAFGVGGVTVRMGAPIYFNVGLGYGTRVYDWETADGGWVENLPGSYSGLAMDGGIMTKIDSVVLSVGATVVSGNADLSLGVGFVF